VLCKNFPLLAGVAAWLLLIAALAAFFIAEKPFRCLFVMTLALANTTL